MTDASISTDSAARWRTEVASYSAPHSRLRAIATLISREECTSVADIGCATGGLRRLLAPGTDYHGVDFVEGLDRRPGDAFTLVDFNGAHLVPIELDAQWIVCSGILEYVRDLPRFLTWLRASSVRKDVRVLLTYFNETHLSLRLRRLRGMEVVGHADWVPLLSRKTLQARIREGGFVVTEEFDFWRDVRTSPSYQGIEVAPRLYRAGRRSSLLAHQWIFLMNRQDR